jgi:PleD family two-component response regulator
LIGRTDAALYEAKRAGRDRVVESRLQETPARNAL